MEKMSKKASYAQELYKKKLASNTEEEDRISYLPDTILHHIISFLDDTKQTVQTSVLSKTWTSLWTSVPDFNFDSKSFANFDNFKKFVLDVLARRDNGCKVNKLRFSCSETVIDVALTDEVVKYAVSHDVNHLIIELGDRSYRLPFKIFWCQSLKTLELIGIDDVVFTAYSKTLTTLCLENCAFYLGDECFTDPFANILNLSKLWLCGCRFKAQKKVKISGPQMVELTMISTRIPGDVDVEISAPRLKTFTLVVTQDEAVPKFSLIDLPSLQHVDVSVPTLQMMHLKAPTEETRRKLLNLYEGIRHAQFVRLCTNTSQVCLSTLLKCFVRYVIVISLCDMVLCCLKWLGLNHGSPYIRGTTDWRCWSLKYLVITAP